MKTTLFTSQKQTLTMLWLIIVTCAYGQKSQLNDEFDNPCSLSEWNNIVDVEGWDAEQLQELNISDSISGSLMMRPWTSAWFEDYRGTLIFKEASGNFTFTSEVTALNGMNETVLPGSTFSLAGLMIRSPKTITDAPNQWVSGDENYVFLSIGRADSGDGGSWQFEVKNTVSSNSNLFISNIPSNIATIRMVRKDNALLVLYRIGGNPWVVHRRYDRPDLPDTVQLGFVTYTDWPNVNVYSYEDHNNNVLNSGYENRNWEADLTGAFNYARFDTAQVPPAMDHLDLTDAAAASDGDLLNWFGDDSAPAVTFDGSEWIGLIDSDWNNPSNWRDGGIPASGDSVWIRNSSCAQVHPPIVPAGLPTLSSLRISSGAQLTIPDGVVLVIDLQAPGSSVTNEGNILVDGVLQVMHASQREVRNRNNITVSESGQLIIDP